MAATRLTIEYLGTGFAGWARQPGLRTVQGELERAITQLRGGDGLALTVAGRTDRGVHAWGQVASYPGEPLTVRALNAVLPDDVTVRESIAMPDGFDARHDATWRSYCYRVLHRRPPQAFEHGRALHWPHRLDDDALTACAAALVGRHDFTAFTPTETIHRHFHRRVQAARWERHGDVLAFHIQAEGFLRHMNRALVGTMLQVGGGYRTVAGFAQLLEGGPRAAAGPTAPPHGLYFAAAGYD